MSVRDLIIFGTSAQQPTRFRNHGGYLLRWNNEGFLFDPGEGTQRQFIFADIKPPTVTRIFVTHFHGDHCLGLGSMLMRLNLDKVTHPIHCYYPASGKKYFDRLRYSTIYHETITVIEHPISEEGIVEEDEHFKIEVAFMKHGVHNLAYKITEKDQVKYDKEKLAKLGIKGELMRKLISEGRVEVDGQLILVEDVSFIRKGDSFGIILDTKLCPAVFNIAKGCKMLLMEATYCEEFKHLAEEYLHLTAAQAATVAKEAGAEKLVLTHFSGRYRDTKMHEAEARAIFPQTIAAEDLMVIPFDK
jgi:ribonuclease Z